MPTTRHDKSDRAELARPFFETVSQLPDVFVFILFYRFAFATFVLVVLVD